MSHKTITLTDELYKYFRSVSTRETEILRRLREETAGLPEAHMQISPEQGQFMSLLVRLLDARKVLEAGTFTGYSTLWMALALPENGVIVTCDINRERTAVAAKFWKEAGVQERIHLHHAPALRTMDQLLEGGGRGKFDFIFLDADKESIGIYYERSLQLLRSGGIMAVDNVLWSGKVAHPGVNDPDTLAIRSFNETVKADTRVMFSMLPLGDGLTLALKE